MFNILASSVIGTVIFKALLALGVGYVTYTGFGIVIDQIYTQMQSAFSSLPDTALNIMGLLGVDLYLGYVFSGWSTVFVVKSLKMFTF